MGWFDFLRRHRAPAPPPEPTQMQLSIYLRDKATGAPLVGHAMLNGTACVGINGSATYPVTRALYGAGLNVDVYVGGYKAQWRAVSEFKDPTVLDVFDMEPLVLDDRGTIGQAIDKLVARGIYVFDSGIVGADGPLDMVGIDGFSALLYWLTDRQKVYDYVDFLIRERIDYSRVFGNFNKGTGQGVGVLISHQIPNYWEEVDLFFAYFKKRHVRILFDCFADMNISSVRPTNPLTEIDQPAFYQRMAALIRAGDHWNVMLGGGNQWQGNGWRPDNLGPKPADVFSLRGSGNEDTLPWLPPWDAAQFDPARSEYYRKPKSFRELRDGDTGPANNNQRVPGVIGLNEGIGVVIGPLNYEDGSSTANPERLYDMYGSAKAFGAAFACIHYRDFISDLLIPPAGSAGLECIRACVRGFREVPRLYALGAYARGNGDGSNRSLALSHLDALTSRTYELRNGPTSLVFAVGRQPAWKLGVEGEPGVTVWWQDGARPVESYGYDRNNPNFFATTRG